MAHLIFRKRSMDSSDENVSSDICCEAKSIARKLWTVDEDEILFTHGPSLVDNNGWDKLLELLPGRTVGAMRKRFLDSLKVKPEGSATEVEQKERGLKRRRGSSVAKFGSDKADEEVADNDAVVPPIRQIKRPSFHGHTQDTCMVVDKLATGITASGSRDTLPNSFPDEKQMYAEYMRSTFACESTDTRESSFSIQKEIGASMDEAEDEVLPFSADVLVDDDVMVEDTIDGANKPYFEGINEFSPPVSSVPPAATVWHEDEAFVRSVLDCLSSDAPPNYSNSNHHNAQAQEFPDDGDHTIDDMGSSIYDFGNDIDDDFFWCGSSGLPHPLSSVKGYEGQQKAAPDEYWSNTARRYETRSATQLRRDVENMVPNYNHLTSKLVYVPCYYMKSGNFTSMYVTNHHSFSGLSRPPPGYHLVHVPAIISNEPAMQVANYPDFPLKFKH